MYRELAQAQRDARLDEEQRKALLMIASGAPMDECLDALTDAVGRLAPDTRACVLLASEDRRTMGDGYSSHFPPTFAAAIRGLPIGEALIGTCGAAIHAGEPVECADVEHSAQWAASWRSLCLDNGILACYSHPAIGQGGRAVGSFFLCLSEARQANAWERKVAEFGALATSIVVERDRAAAHLRKEMAALARLQELSAELVGPGEFEPLLQKILAAAADISGTDKGNIQIFDPVRKTLRIVVHQGLGARLVEHFLEDGWDASCGEAARQIRRLVVPDVERLEGLQGTLGLEMVLEDRIRSIQCTPLLSRDGRLLGMLNNHYRWPGGPAPDALRYIDLLARQAAELVERHQIEAELAQERRRKDEFLAMLAHELRNPLAPLRNMLEVMGRAHGDEALSRRARDVMERQVLQLVRLVDDLLDVNRIKQGKLELRREPLLLAEVVHQAVEVCRPALDQQQHRLRLVMPDAPVPLQGDSARLTQVFGNLLANACKYTPSGGDIEVRVEPAGHSVEVVVKDNGSGIPPDQIDEIFGLFTQVDRTLDRAQGGLGIGLMLVRRLVEMHGGTVQARSEGAGKGSEFIVRLPSGVVSAEVSAARNSHPAAVARRILVVDDNEDIALALATLLQLDGHEVRTAAGGAEALEAGGQMCPEVVLMDIGMPGMSGHEACRRMRELDWGRSITIVALTGWGQDGDRRHSERVGFDAHLVKPVGFAELNGLLAGLA
ncbi:hybrid sensor histidine kinase/response regulator [Paracidovorax avenae]|uniref:hybrid sensor histidine kinase/response regulator n=1 Tax=Paracidovorax avenae TaxID=80867 RepID=UPI000D20D929|nr:ATP-binding protein [Paracidovorax avenae]AVS67948.1 hybrid sensor histidine kinase/response regulator [Paracidovorax avenae]